MTNDPTCYIVDRATAVAAMEKKVATFEEERSG